MEFLKICSKTNKNPHICELFIHVIGFLYGFQDYWFFLFIFTSGLFFKLSPPSASGMGMLVPTPNNTSPPRVTYFLYTSSYHLFFFYFNESFLSHLIYTHTNTRFLPTTHKSYYVGRKQRVQSTIEVSPTVGEALS